MKKAFNWFLTTYVVFFAFGIIIFFIVDHGEVVLLFNQHRTSFLDFFFRYWTYLGDGIFVLLLIVLILFIRYAYAITLFVIGVGQGLVTLILKKFVFGEVPRPGKFFEAVYELSLIDGVKMNNYYSFPSGHTMTAFGIATFLSLISQKKFMGIIWCLYAVLVGASRIYTLQHFYRDTLAGSLIGILVSLLLFWIFKARIERGWQSGNLIQTLKKRR